MNFRTWDEAVRWLRDQPDQKELVLNAYYDDPLIDAARRYHASDEWRAIRVCLPLPGSGPVLDIGAGRGIASYAFAVDGYDVTALEPDSSELVGSGAIRQLAREASLDIKVREDFSERLPFDDGQFSVVFARAVLHHTKDMKMACRELFRVLRPGGRLIAVREHVISRVTDLDAFFAIHPLHHLYGGENAFRLDDYTGAISEAGFMVNKVFGPLDSAINLAPHTPSSFRREIARRAGQRITGAEALARGLLAFPGAWSLVKLLARRFDQRPGRLYSFIAERP